MLAVTNPSAAIDFYQRAFNATMDWNLDRVIAGFRIDDARFFLAEESPDFGTRAPLPAGFTTVRIELFVDDPVEVQRRAIAAGAKEHSPVSEHQYPTEGPRPIGRMLQGAIVDPFGHMWLIGKFLE